MPDRGDERGRGGTRTLVTGILAGTEWHPATNPREATQTAREARDLAVRLRPVLSKLAQAPRGGRRRDLEWLPAVEQLAVDAQYFASWWLPRLEGKSAQSWPSWSADGYADWVKRLDAQRLRTLEMVEGTAPVTRIASVTQLRRGKGTAEAEAEPASGGTEAPGTGPGADEQRSQARHGRQDPELAKGPEEERTARITPLRGPGAALMDAALLDVTRVSESPSFHVEESEPSRSADETHISKAAPVSREAVVDDADADDDITTIAGNLDNAGSVDGAAPAASLAASEEGPRHSAGEALPPVPRTPPNQGPVEDDANATHIQRVPMAGAPLGFDDIAAGASDAATGPRVPRTPPNQGPGDDAGVGADILQIPRTPPNSGPPQADLPRDQPRAPIVSLVGDGDGPRVPRTPPNSGPVDRSGSGTGNGNDSGLSAGLDADSTHISLAPVAPAAPGGRTGATAGTRSGSGAKTLGVEAGALAAGALGAKALAGGTGNGAGTGTGTGNGNRNGSGNGTGAEEQTRPLFRSEPPSPPSAAASVAVGAASPGHAVGVGMYGSGSPSHDDEFENFQPGSDLPPPIFPMREPTEPVDRGRIVRYALAAVVLAAAGVAVFVAATQKGSDTKTAAAPATSSASSTAQSSASASPSSSISGAVTAPTSTDAPPPSSTASKAAPPPPKPSTPPSTAPKTSASSYSAPAPPPTSQPISHQPPPVSGGVSSLSITSLAPDSTGGYNYVAHVHVTTNGTGTVTIMVTFAGTSSSGSPGSVGSETLPFTMSGKTSYDFVAQTDVHGMCQPSQPYIDAVASASGAGSSAAYASSPC